MIHSIFYEILLTDNLDQDTLPSASIELSIEDLFPRSEIQFALRHSHDHLAPHDLTFHMRVGIVFPCVVVTVLVDRFVGCEPLQPLIIILMQSMFIIIDEN